MATGIAEEIRADSASLYHFVESICALCENPTGAYIAPSDQFFAYITELGAKTKLYLSDFPAHIPRDPAFHRIYRQKLTILRGCWSEPHRLIKPSTDADTLNVPFPLLAAFYNKLNTLNHFADVTFTVFHLHDVNYVQIRASWIRELTNKLVSHIPTADAFPKSLGLIGIPYSLRSAVFLNSLIPHEIGHFVFQELDKWSDLRANAAVELASVCGANAALLTSEDVAWALDRIASWSEEIFCDLFAVRMAGPAYAFAYIELFDLMRIVYSRPSATTDELEFSHSHPADAFRLSQHVALLRTLGWWDEVQSFDTHYVRVLNQVAVLPQSQYTFPLPVPFPLAEKTLEAFLNISPNILALVESAVEYSLDSGVSDFKCFNRLVEDSLHHGIVPSTVVTADGERHNPTSTTILNSAYKVALESLDTLIDKIHDQDKLSVRVRSQWRGPRIVDDEGVGGHQLVVGSDQVNPCPFLQRNSSKRD